MSVTVNSVKVFVIVKGQRYKITKESSMRDVSNTLPVGRVITVPVTVSGAHKTQS